MRKLWIVIIILAVIGISSYFSYDAYKQTNEYKAMQAGVDVKYFDDPKYCEVDSDCPASYGKVSNKYFVKNGAISSTALPEHVICTNNQCQNTGYPVRVYKYIKNPASCSDEFVCSQKATCEAVNEGAYNESYSSCPQGKNCLNLC